MARISGVLHAGVWLATLCRHHQTITAFTSTWKTMDSVTFGDRRLVEDFYEWKMRLIMRTFFRVRSIRPQPQPRLRLIKEKYVDYCLYLVYTVYTLVYLFHETDREDFNLVELKF